MDGERGDGMAFLPPLRGVKRKRNRIDGFAGLNHNRVINERELYDMRNMQSGFLPVLAPRNKRARVRQFAKPNGLFAHDKLCWVDGVEFFYDGEFKGNVADSEKTFARMGAYVLIWPDKVYYNTNTKDGEFGSLENAFTSTGTVTAKLCRADGVLYDYKAGDTAPDSPDDGDFWLDTSDVKPALRLYSAATGIWGGVATVYVKIEHPGIGIGFSMNDGVTLEGFEDGLLNGSFYLVDAAPNAIIVVAIIADNLTQTAPVTVKREVPDLDFITVLNNRAWGCSSAKHEIYGSKLGDPKNWHCYMGTSMDSYTATVGSGGDFTGCVAHMGQVLFFKEDRILKLFGTRPSNFQLDDSALRGVGAGNSKSIAIVNETLIYHSAVDVCAFGQALPVGISDALVGLLAGNAVSGAFGHLYYMSTDHPGDHPGPTGHPSEGGELTGRMFVYDTKKGVWMLEDETYARFFAAWNNDLYYVSGDDHCLYSVAGNMEFYGDDSVSMEPSFEWYVETGDIGLNLPDGKYISGLQIFVEAELNSHLRVEAKFDGCGEWGDLLSVPQFLRYFYGSPHGVTKEPVKLAFTIPLHTPRCNTVKLLLSGRNDVKIYSMTYTVEQGSEAEV